VDDFALEFATLVDAPPAGPGWIFEPKLDGYRMLCRVDRGRAALVSRSGKEWTTTFASVARAAANLPVKSAVLDGEVCVMNADGRSDFQALQGALRAGAGAELAYFVFDLLALDGQDLRARALLERKAILAKLLARASSPLHMCEHVEGDGEKLHAEACRLGLEGIVAKRGDARYVGKRSLDWQKVKCQRRQELAILGFTPPRGSRKGLGALLLGVREGDGYRYAGKVGTGFSDADLVDLLTRLTPLVREAPAARDAPRLRAATWVEPRLACEVRFTEWTREGSLRHPTFLGLREDKEAKDATREEPVTGVRTRAGDRVDVAGVAVSHPERVVDAASGTTKLEVARYLETMAPHILDHAAKRPLALVRCPGGVDGQHFFQKHARRGFPAEVKTAKAGDDEVLFVENVAGLVALGQMSVLELHGWGSRIMKPERPDVVVMDLDPDEGLPWSRVADAALAVRDRLARLGLVSFVKTTGGKGLHVVVPLAPVHGWESVRGFSEALAKTFVESDPRDFTATMSKRARRGKIFVDWLRNGRGATAVLPYSPRAREGVTVALPIAWRDVHRVEPAALTVKSIPARVAKRRRDPWEGFFDLKQRLPAPWHGMRTSAAR